ncbi:hypothetical protein [Kitasatospora sp. NPDC051914]|uniref:hypothetical protein n=1 Tax=Kitasatospora sp. NPDC051914 TaxID=3154945 RepID=UPI003423523A
MACGLHRVVQAVAFLICGVWVAVVVRHLFQRPGVLVGAGGVVVKDGVVAR